MSGIDRADEADDTELEAVDDKDVAVDADREVPENAPSYASGLNVRVLPNVLGPDLKVQLLPCACFELKKSSTPLPQSSAIPPTLLVNIFFPIAPTPCPTPMTSENWSKASPIWENRCCFSGSCSSNAAVLYPVPVIMAPVPNIVTAIIKGVAVPRLATASPVKATVINRPITSAPLLTLKARCSSFPTLCPVGSWKVIGLPWQYPYGLTPPAPNGLRESGL